MNAKNFAALMKTLLLQQQESQSHEPRNMAVGLVRSLFPCPHCPKLFANNYFLNNHLQRRHKQNPLTVQSQQLLTTVKQHGQLDRSVDLLLDSIVDLKNEVQQLGTTITSGIRDIEFQKDDQLLLELQALRQTLASVVAKPARDYQKRSVERGTDVPIFGHKDRLESLGTHLEDKSAKHNHAVSCSNGNATQMAICQRRRESMRNWVDERFETIQRLCGIDPSAERISSAELDEAKQKVEQRHALGAKHSHYATPIKRRPPPLAQLITTEAIVHQENSTLSERSMEMKPFANQMLVAPDNSNMFLAVKDLSNSREAKTPDSHIYEIPITGAEKQNSDPNRMSAMSEQKTSSDKKNLSDDPAQKTLVYEEMEDDVSIAMPNMPTASSIIADGMSAIEHSSAEKQPLVQNKPPGLTRMGKAMQNLHLIWRVDEPEALSDVDLRTTPSELKAPPQDLRDDVSSISDIVSEDGDTEKNQMIDMAIQSSGDRLFQKSTPAPLPVPRTSKLKSFDDSTNFNTADEVSALPGLLSRTASIRTTQSLDSSDTSVWLDESSRINHTPVDLRSRRHSVDAGDDVSIASFD